MISRTTHPNYDRRPSLATVAQELGTVHELAADSVRPLPFDPVHGGECDCRRCVRQYGRTNRASFRSPESARNGEW